MKAQYKWSSISIKGINDLIAHLNGPDPREVFAVLAGQYGRYTIIYREEL